MRRRDFNLAALAAASVTACGGGGGGGDANVAGASAPAAAPSAGPGPAPAPAPGADPVPAPAPAPAPVPDNRLAMGTALPSMELTGDSAIRFGGSTRPNVNYAVPRQADLRYLRDNGFTKNRLPIRWEMLQPILFDTNASASVQAILGAAPGAFHPVYESFIQQTLDAHAAVGMKCMLDVHNYCRYTDFIYQPDGSVAGGVSRVPADPSVHAWANDPSQVTVRIMSLRPEKAPERTLSIAQYVDFMKRLLLRWKGHPGLSGIGLMNEPHWLPAKDGVDSSQKFEDAEDLTIWPTFAKAAILAMRQIDTETPIYLGGNLWSTAWNLPLKNPGFPIDAPNLIYEVHAYLDSINNGNGADWDVENSKKYPDGSRPEIAGLPGVYQLNDQTGVDRMRPAVEYAKQHGLRLALTETGVPGDDPTGNWQASWLNLLKYCEDNKVEVCSWGGGSFWAYRSKQINQAANWHQNRTMDPVQAGPMKQVMGVWNASIFDDVATRDAATGAVTVTVYARGSLQTAVTLLVSSNNGGTFSKTTLTIPAGANGKDSFTFTPAGGVTTLHYTSAFAPNVPPDRKVYFLTDTEVAALAATNLADAAMAILAKYSACKWELADGFTDYMQGVPSVTGQPIRALAESGFGSSPGNPMEMLNWFSTGPNQNQFSVPVMQVVNGHRCADLRAPNAFGLWCHKQLREPTQQPKAVNVVPYHIDEPHFAIAAISVPNTGGNGAVFQASTGEHVTLAELAIVNGRPAARWVDQNNVKIAVTSPTALTPDQPAVISLLGAQGNQRLRVNSAQQGTAAATLQSTPLGFDQLLLGSGFVSHFPTQSFGGFLFSAVTGKGNPSVTEMTILEKYLATTAGVTI
jgi:endoglucanase